MNNIATTILIIAFISLIILFNGCSNKTQIVEKLVPTRCDIEIPERPILNSSYEPENLQKLMIYSDKLHSALIFCVKGEF